MNLLELYTSYQTTNINKDWIRSYQQVKVHVKININMNGREQQYFTCKSANNYPLLQRLQKTSLNTGL